MAAFAPDFSHFWLAPREEPKPRERTPAPVAPAADPDEALLRELVERVAAARTVA